MQSMCVFVCVQHWENGAIHRITGRQLFEKKGLYLHKQPWKRKTCRKKDGIREQAKEKGRREDKKIKRRGLGSGPHLPSHSGINPVVRIKYCGQGFGPRPPQSKWKITACE